MVPMLTPPWYTVANKIKYTYGRSPYVKVKELAQDGLGNYILPIFVSSNSIAKALRQVIPVSFTFGNITLTTIIFNCEGEVVPVLDIVYTPELLADAFCVALKMNPLFKGAVLKPEGVPTTIADVILVIAKEVVQFYNDDISDLCSNYNEVAAKTFADVTVTQFPVELTVGFTTYDPKCSLQKNMVCRNCHEEHRR